MSERSRTTELSPQQLRRKLARAVVATAVAEHQEETVADREIGIAELNEFNQRSAYRPETAGRVHSLLARQLGVYKLEGNPIKPMDDEHAPDFPLRFTHLPTEDEIEHSATPYKAYENLAKGLSFKSLLEYLRIINDRVERYGPEDALKSVFAKPGARKVTMPVVDFLNDFSLELLDKN
jgi:hypothetical protein